jgi:glycine betaine/choline ABC-type transport system substrate-binding protein
MTVTTDTALIYTVRTYTDTAAELATARQRLAVLEGLQERAQAVRALHDMYELPGGRLICYECSRPRDYVDWPCETTRLLDGCDAVTW